jgi:cytochrome c
MDSFEVNKILGAILGTLTFTLALSIGADMLFSAHAPEKPGYELPSPAEDAGHGAGAPAAAQAEPIAVRLAKADPAKGEKLTAACHSCHTFEKGGPNKVGPNLYGVVGNHHAHLDSFSYSGPMKEKSGEQWTFEALDHFLENPKAAIPGTAMSFIGIKKPDQRADVIAWLNQNSDKPLPLPAAPPPGEAAAPAGAPAEGAAPAGGAPAPGAGDAGTTGPTGVPQPESGKANVPPTPPSGAPQGGTPENPQGGAGNKAPVQAPAAPPAPAAPH